MMKIAKKSKEKIAFIAEIDISLANALRRNVNEIPVLAIDEVDIYKNDSALYDQIIAHRLGLVPLKNEKLIEFSKCSCKGKGCSKCTIQLKLKSDEEEVLSGKLGEEVVYGDIPIVYLEKGQELELVAKARVGRGKDHAKFSPGLFYYRYLPKIEITKEGEKWKELAEIYPKVFSFDGKLKVENEWECDLEQEDLKDYKGVNITLTEKLVIIIESWGQIDAEDIFTESIKSLKGNLSELSKALD